MWAPTHVSFGFYRSSITNTRYPPADHRCSSVISALPRRNLHQTHSSSSSQRQASEEDIGGLGHAVLNALHSSSTSPNLSDSKTLPTANRKPSKQQKQKQSVKEERDLSGSEVLLALQKARARKSHSLKKTKKKEDSAVVGGISGGREAATDWGNVRTLIVKDDWGVRLKELEMRLQDFLNA